MTQSVPLQIDNFKWQLSQVGYGTENIQEGNSEKQICKCPPCNIQILIFAFKHFFDCTVVSELCEKSREACRPRGEFKHRYWFFADTPNIVRIFCVIWKDLSWLADPCRHLKYRGGCTIVLFQISVWCEKFVAARQDADIGIQLLIANNSNRVRGAVLGLSQDRVCTDLFENLSVNS